MDRHRLVRGSGCYYVLDSESIREISAGWDLGLHINRDKTFCHRPYS
jgi:hypothetical protein